MKKEGSKECPIDIRLDFDEIERLLNGKVVKKHMGQETINLKLKK